MFFQQHFHATVIPFFKQTLSSVLQSVKCVHSRTANSAHTVVLDLFDLMACFYEMVELHCTLNLNVLYSHCKEP